MQGKGFGVSDIVGCPGHNRTTCRYSRRLGVLLVVPAGSGDVGGSHCGLFRIPTSVLPGNGKGEDPSVPCPWLGSLRLSPYSPPPTKSPSLLLPSSVTTAGLRPHVSKIPYQNQPRLESRGKSGRQKVRRVTGTLDGS